MHLSTPLLKKQAFEHTGMSLILLCAGMYVLMLLRKLIVMEGGNMSVCNRESVHAAMFSLM